MWEASSLNALLLSPRFTKRASNPMHAAQATTLWLRSNYKDSMHVTIHVDRCTQHRP